MKIGIVGGGPGGLYFALLMKKENPDHHIVIYEQNPAGATYGWGVVFSGRALSFLEDRDSASYADINNSLAVWDELHIGHRGEIVPIDGSKFSGISRLELLQILQRHCLQQGVEIHFEARLENLDVFADCDLIVGADGANSVVRQLYQAHFQPTETFLTNKYIWYGTHQLFPALSLIWRESVHGSFVTHTYPYSKTTSTFIVECEADTWERAGFTEMTDEEIRAYCEAVFQVELGGHPLLTNKSNWLNFKVVQNKHWIHNNIILIGDALRTVHFSIGSGTRTALEDAIALFEACKAHDSDVAAALSAFEANRRPSSDSLLDVAGRSIDWYENYSDILHLTPLDFAYNYMTRGGRVDHEKLKVRAPKFTAAYEAQRS
ncbi:MAG: FAD-dependent monooxygenase [Chloroflexota bacterium]